MIEMGMRQQHKIDCARIKSERDRVFLVQFSAPLKQAAINQNVPSADLQKMTGSRYVLICAVKRKFHALSPSL
jgi:hypothetical protein